MATSKLTVVINHEDWVQVAKSTNPRTVQKCLSLIAEEEAANPPTADAIALEAAEKMISELKSMKLALESQIITLTKKIPSPMTDKQPEPTTA